MWTELLSKLRVIAMFYQTAHWSVKGKNFYQEHLLFERLYNQVIPEIDLVAEKTLYVEESSDSLKYHKVLKSIIKNSEELVGENNDSQNYLINGILLEKNLIDFLNKNINNNFSEGTRDLIAEIINSHEQNIYLLRSQLD